MNYCKIICRNILINCTVKENAVDIINNLKEKDYKIYLITARSNNYNLYTYDITIKFLNDNHIYMMKCYLDIKIKELINSY